MLLLMIFGYVNTQKVKKNVFLKAFMFKQLQRWLDKFV
jgi:hypothetical protein